MKNEFFQLGQKFETIVLDYSHSTTSEAFSRLLLKLMVSLSVDWKKFTFEISGRV